MMETMAAVVLGAEGQTRSEIADLLGRESVRVLHQTGCSLQAFDCVRLQRPEMVVVEIAAGCFEGIHTVRQFRELDPAIKIIVLTRQSPRHFSTRYQRVGATVLLSSSRGIKGLEFILRAMRAGYGHFDFFHAPLKRREWTFAGESDLIATLTDRELTVCQGLAAGMSNQEIAMVMNIGSRSVSCYKTNVFEKLQLQTLLQLEELAVRNKLI